MRGFFPRLLLSFFLTFLLAGSLSGLVMFSLSRSSVELYRNEFLQRLQANVARSVVLMGQAAYMMWDHWGDQALEEYIGEIESSMRTRLYIALDNKILPAPPLSYPYLAQLASRAGSAGHPLIEEENGELQVAQRLYGPEGRSYVVIGLHMMDPSPGAMTPLTANNRGPAPRSLIEGGTIFGFLDQWLGLLFFIFLPVAGFICFLVARSFSAPLERLRQVSRSIAEGDLSARVGGSLGTPGNEFGDLGRDFDLMAERMEGLLTSQKRLLFDISHELRSPLTRLILALELAQTNAPENDGNLARIGRESQRMNELIGRLLSLSRSDSTVADTGAPLILLADLLREIAHDVDFEYRNRSKGVKVLDLAALSVAGSPELLREAIENIVRNAAYYTRPGSFVEVGLSLDTDPAGTQVALICVRDYGPGVAEDALAHLTEPFFRVAEARDRKSGGVGLGLAIAQQAIRQHGGTLRFTNAPDRNGLIVEILLPIPEPSTPSGDGTAPANPDAA